MEKEKNMKKHNHRWYGIFLFLILLSLFFSCRSVPPLKEWKTVNKPEKNQWSLQIIEGNKAVMHIPFDGLAEIDGEAYEEEDLSWIFYTDSLHLFYNWFDGWTESQIALRGAVRLTQQESGGWSLTVIETPQLGAVQSAEIRYRRNKISGDRAVDLMNRRLARSESVAEFIGSSLSLSTYSFDNKKKGYYSKDFEKTLRQILFPEVYGYSHIYPRPDSQGSWENRFVKQDETRWDTQYTSVYFPEELKDVRNSGTLSRDYEEASGLIYINCIWQELWTSIIPQSAIQEF